MLGACLQAAAAITCHAYDTMEAVATQTAQAPLAIEWDRGTHAAADGCEGRLRGRWDASEVAKAFLVLLHRATACETPSGSCTTATVLWTLLLLSESNVVSQWTVASVACTACFCVMPFLAEFGDVLDQLSLTVLQALPVLWLPGLRGKCGISLCMGAFLLWLMPGALALRATTGMVGFMACLLWQMQGTPPRECRSHQQ